MLYLAKIGESQFNLNDVFVSNFHASLTPIVNVMSFYMSDCNSNFGKIFQIIWAIRRVNDILGVSAGFACGPLSGGALAISLFG